MNMKTNHVVSLELSLALRDAGYPQEGSTFYWSIPMPERAANEKERLVLSNQCEVQLCHKWTEWGDKFQNVAAPIASELGEMLMDGRLTQYCFKQTQGWGWKSFTLLGTPVVFTEYSDTEADARAKMLIHLLKNKLITL
jgi:hypothetical protein